LITVTVRKKLNESVFMLKIAITGLMGSGKTTLAEQLGTQGAHVADIDKIIRSILDSNHAVVTLLEAKFGKAFIDNGVVNLKQMYELFAEDAAAFPQFHQIIYPVAEKMAAQIYIDAIKNNASYFVLVMPQISDSKKPSLKKFDFTIDVTCSKENQLRRLVKRTALGLDQINALITLESSLRSEVSSVDLIIKNDDSMQAVEQQAINLHKVLNKKAKK
jgi:dephospho-CoA kinase